MQNTIRTHSTNIAYHTSIPLLYFKEKKYSLLQLTKCLLRSRYFHLLNDIVQHNIYSLRILRRLVMFLLIISFVCKESINRRTLHNFEQQHLSLLTTNAPSPYWFFWKSYRIQTRFLWRNQKSFELLLENGEWFECDHSSC